MSHWEVTRAVGNSARAEHKREMKGGKRVCPGVHKHVGAWRKRATTEARKEESEGQGHWEVGGETALCPYSGVWLPRATQTLHSDSRDTACLVGVTHDPKEA